MIRYFLSHMSINPIQLLALDLDGTILTSKKQVTPRTKESLLAAIAAGIEVVLVTGRPYLGLPDELLTIPGLHYAITSNGAVSTDLISGRKIRSSLIAPTVAREILDIPLRSRLIYNIFLDGAGYCEPQTYEQLLRYFTGTPLEDYVRKSRRPTDRIAELILEAKEGVENIWIMSRDQSERDQIHALIRDRWQLNTVLTAATDVEIGAPGSDKGLAVQELAAGLGIEKSHILAIGDGENDLGMLRSAGTAVAMGNASDPVRRLADVITDNNDQDGAAKAIERYCLYS